MQLNRRSCAAGLVLSGCAGRSAGQSSSSFGAPDGATLTGHRYGQGRKSVVLVPGGHGVGETWDLQARQLARDGFRVLALDYRGRGASPSAPPDDEKAHLDVLGAVRQLRSEGAEEVSVVGASWGGWAAGTAAIEAPDEISRLILLAHSPVDQPERLGGRKLFVLAGEDRDGRGQLRLDGIRDQYDRAPNPKTLIVLPGAAHAQFLFLTRHGDRLYAEMLRFLSAP